MTSLGLWLVGAFWALFAIRWALDIRAIPLLPPLRPSMPRHKVSVVVAARDEKARIETTVRRLLVQKGIDLQVIVVDDRSTDGTGEILNRLAREYPALKVIRVEELPEKWIGKCHSLHVGSQAATSEWILFADADSWMSEDLVARAVDFMEKTGTDHLCLLPSQRKSTIPGRAANIVFSSTLVPTVAGSNRDSRFAFIGIGAFNLVRKRTYDASGGYERLRLEVCDDVKLGLLLKRTGGRTRGCFAGHDLEVDWAGSARAMVRAIEKNAFAILRFNVFLAGIVILSGFAMWAAALSGPFVTSPAGVAAFLGLFMTIVPARMMTSRAKWGWAPVFLTPFCFPLIPLAILRSTWITLRQGGVSWRGTLYPLRILRRGLVR